ncbi:hypothetical protein LF845_04270 [Deferribacterales bacterium Es71-Z0220]|jgi:hypothetical protein|uniref:hypothetical protein n=1 Tax=Deferrivibrio essentukiensis TaxID=2880922 RepID=UPI001F615953|nr:hypothetical protein [Deferrivibrio essentukiensis]MBZ4671954.1 hypothetical protein [Deferribacteraceae bacterium]MCB4204175.1 hypothetical protein [Deferrivibrio essentukiensis]
MIEINLLKYLNKSFSEIYEIEHSVEVQPHKKKKFSLFTIYLISGSILLIGAIIVTTMLILREPKGEEKVKTFPGNIIVDNTSKKDKAVSEYKVIGTININDNISTNEANTAKTHTEATKSEPKTTNKDKIINSKAVQPLQNVKTAPKAKPHVKNISEQKQDKNTTKPFYTISIENIDYKTYNLLLKNIKGKTIKITKRWTINTKTWDVYVQENGTKEYIGGHEVKKIKTFKSKDEAIIFAKKLSQKVIIKSKDAKINYFNIEISNFNSVDEAKIYARNINISGKVLKILKKSN